MDRKPVRRPILQSVPYYRVKAKIGVFLHFLNSGIGLAELMPLWAFNHCWLARSMEEFPAFRVHSECGFLHRRSVGAVQRPPLHRLRGCVQALWRRMRQVWRGQDDGAVRGRVSEMRNGLPRHAQARSGEVTET